MRLKNYYVLLDSFNMWQTLFNMYFECIYVSIRKNIEFYITTHAWTWNWNVISFTLYSKRYFTKSRTFTISHNWVRRHVLTLEHVQIYELKSQPSEFKIIVFPRVQVQTSLIQLVGLNTEVTFAKSDVGDISSCSDFYNFGPWFDQNWIQLHEWPNGLRIQPNRITAFELTLLYNSQNPRLVFQYTIV